MKTAPPLQALLFLAAGLALFSTAPAYAEGQVIKTFPPGSSADILNESGKDKKNPVGPEGGALVVDRECAKKTMKGKDLKTGEHNPEYEACVKKRLEDAKKKNAQ